MSRSGYTDDCENVQLWRGAVAQATYGARGQKMLRDLLAALDAMQTKRLIQGTLEENGEVCALGSLARIRNIDISHVDEDDRDKMGKLFNIAPALAAEIVYENDEGARGVETPEQRWLRVRKWVSEQIK
jgi:hypothetical protein